MAEKNKPNMMNFHWRSLFLVFLVTMLSALNVHAYIPASPSNDSTTAANFTATAMLNLAWFRGVYSENVSYQLVGADSTGYNEVCLILYELYLGSGVAVDIGKDMG